MINYKIFSKSNNNNKWNINNDFLWKPANKRGEGNNKHSEGFRSLDSQNNLQFMTAWAEKAGDEKFILINSNP